MADKKISQHPAISYQDVDDDDILVIVNNPSGNPVTKTITISNLRQFVSLDQDNIAASNGLQIAQLLSEVLNLNRTIDQQKLDDLYNTQAELELALSENSALLKYFQSLEVNEFRPTIASIIIDVSTLISEQVEAQKVLDGRVSEQRMNDIDNLIASNELDLAIAIADMKNI